VPITLTRPVFSCVGPFRPLLLVLTLITSSVVELHQADAAWNVTQVGATATQIILSYTATDSNPCAIQLSESASLTPLVPDMNPALFPGSNSDARPGTVTSATSRIVVLGRRATERASDGNVYSRALQANTTHYVRITCGSVSDTVSVVTRNIPNGMTLGETLVADPTGGGASLSPTPSSTDRNWRTIDPWTGALIRNATLAGDIAGASAIGGTSGGMHTICSNNLSAQGFYRCAMAISPGGNGRGLYAIKPDTGEVRFLGRIQFAGQV